MHVHLHTQTHTYMYTHLAHTHAEGRGEAGHEKAGQIANLLDYMSRGFPSGWKKRMRRVGACGGGVAI